MFKLASIVHKQTREIEKEIIDKLLFSYRENIVRSIEGSKQIGEYSVSMDTRKNTPIEKQALKLLKEELKKKGYKVFIKYTSSRWDDYYTITVKWLTYTK